MKQQRLAPSKTPQVSLWNDLFYSEDKLSPLKDFPHIEHFRETFLKVLRHFEKSPLAPITVNLLSSKSFKYSEDEKDNQQTFANGLEALESLILDGVNIFSRAHMYIPRRNRYNLAEHIDNVQLRKNPTLLPLLKEILHQLPSTEEFIFDDVDYQILLECLDQKMMPPSQLAKQLSSNDERPVYYFEQESKDIFSLIALKGNYKAKKISNNIAIYRKEASELEQRQQTGLTMAALAEIIDYLLPTVLIKLISEYTNSTNIILLANSLSQQLKSIKMKFGYRFTEFEARPYVLDILEEALIAVANKKHLSVCWDGRNTHAFEEEKEFAWDATKVIAKLIRGVKIQYGSSKKVTERFAQTQSASFYLLKFFKDFVLKGPADPAVQQFILDLIELANTHTSFEMTNQMIQRECKTFPTLSQASPVEVIANAEKQLNAYLTQQNCENWAVNFMTVNPAGITIYVNTSLVLASHKLMQLVVSEFSIHISPLFVHQLLQLSSTDNQKWNSYDEGKRGEVIKNLISPRFKVQPQTVYNVSYFHKYGYKVKVSKIAYNQIKSASLFGQSGDQNMINPVERSILGVLKPLEKNLNSYDQERKLIVKDFINGFKQDFTKKFATFTNSEEAFKVGEKFVLEWFSSLALLPKTHNDFLPSSSLFSPSSWFSTSTLEKDFNQAVKNLQDLKNSLQQLKHQARTGEIALVLHTLPPDRSFGASK